MEKLRKLKYVFFLLLVLCMVFGAVTYVNAAEETIDKGTLYENMLEAYRTGNQMDAWVVEARKEIAEELGLSEYLDDRSFLSVEYRYENNIGSDGEITDKKLNLLVEMATEEEEEAILAKSTIHTFAESRSINTGESVKVIQMPRVSGAGNGYFSVENSSGYADSYGYCAQNSLSFWNNGGAFYAAISEWNHATARKVLYYAPGGPGYAGPYYGSLGADMDYTTSATSYLRTGSCHNTSYATAYINYVSGLADPINYGYKAFVADITNYYAGNLCQDVAFLSYSYTPPATTTLTIEKRSSTDLYSGDGYKYLTGAVFDLYSFNGSTFNKLVSTSTDNGNGTYTFHNIPTDSTYGYYLVKERTAPGGYQNKYYFFNSNDERDYQVYGGRHFQLDTSNLTWTCSTLSGFRHPDWGFTFLDYPNNVTVTITKKDSETGEKLTGAEFELWAYKGGTTTSESGVPGYSYRVGEFTDNNNGTYSITFPFDLAIYNGSYYWFMYKETKAPDGYEKDAWAAEGYGIYFDKNGKGTTEFVVENTPYPKIQISKSSAEPELTTGNDCYSLKDAEYEVYSDEACTNVVGTFVTDENGQSSYISVEPGTYWMKEKVAPKGFALDLQRYSITVEAGDIKTFNVMDHPLLDLNLTKKQEKTDVFVSGAVFEHTKPDGTTEVLTTDERGKVSFKALNYGDHELREVSAEEGYLINGNVIKFSVATDNNVTFTSENDETVELSISEEGNIEVTVYEKVVPFSFVIHKQNEKGKNLQGAEFTLYADAACTQVVQAGISGSEGIIRFENLTAETTYYLKETKAPAGYRLPIDAKGNPMVTEFYVTSVPIQDEFNLYVNGSEYEFTSEGAFSLTGTKAAQEINMVVVNEMGYVLPRTGSSITLITMLAGVFLFVLGTSIEQTKKEGK